ncbi:hypothetical protein PR048_007390 [Dryococelus australis]|uniref:Uncharacterized protein n=1 Tax=Dryococelus australis TaxID=614101 RepID=A0ABQ9HU80_9NEOP|nr:hypothetical protein PR048_007390 [Dryococelus australis]
MDEPVPSGKESFKANILFVVLDTATGSRTQQLEPIESRKWDGEKCDRRAGTLSRIAHLTIHATFRKFSSECVKPHKCFQMFSISLRVLLTLLISVASGELSFSKLN